MEELVIAVDPGREKCGLAVVHRTQGVLARQVLAVASLADTIREWSATYQTRVVVLGNRTASRGTRSVLTAIITPDGPLQVIPIEEHHSTEEARQRYWRENPPRGLWRLAPIGLRVPPCPVDDWVAVILAERYFAQK
jgi:RNase H-fold protein (predicted Holliday junction resolvase)